MANCYFAKPHGMQHCYIPFLYVIGFKGALNFGEAVRPGKVDMFSRKEVNLQGQESEAP
jgi:hypothetical protein